MNRRLRHLGRGHTALLRAHDASVTRFLDTGDTSGLIPYAERFAGLYSAHADAHMLGVHHLNDRGERLSGDFTTEAEVVADDIAERQARSAAKRNQSEPRA